VANIEKFNSQEHALQIDDFELATATKASGIVGQGSQNQSYAGCQETLLQELCS